MHSRQTRPLDESTRCSINIRMRTTLDIDDGIFKKASELTGVGEKTALVRMGLETLIARRSAERLAALGGTEPKTKPVPRRKPRR
jgi:hypothetical protein